MGKGKAGKQGKRKVEEVEGAPRGAGDLEEAKEAQAPSVQFPTPVLPGDNVSGAVLAESTAITIGPGLKQLGNNIVATRAGLLYKKDPTTYWVETDVKRYIPNVGDMVVGIVSERMSEHYRLKFGGSNTALLHQLEFDGASKRNKPNLTVGTLVYARVVKADKDLEPELSCKVESGPKKDWVTGESVYGELKGGNVLRCSVGHAKRLLAPDNAVLNALGNAFPYEVAVGINGLVWVNAGSVKEVIVATNAIMNSQYLSDKASEGMVRKLVDSML